MKALRLFLFLLLCQTTFESCSQNTKPPFQEEIEKFREADKKSMPPANAILFVGSSSFRLWKDLQASFPGYPVVNRGFGGAELKDLIYYADQIIMPYKPRQVVIYCGENDIASGTVKATGVLERFTTLFKKIRKELPNAHIAYVSMKPSPSREKFRKEIEDGNIMIRQFLSSYPETVYIDIYHRMLDKNGQPIEELFVEDKLHMNIKGYAIWKEAITPYLLKQE